MIGPGSTKLRTVEFCLAAWEWLVAYKTVVRLCYNSLHCDRCINGTAPRYLARVSNGLRHRVASPCDLHRQRCCTFHGRCTRPSATVSSPLPLRESGTKLQGRSKCYVSRLVSMLLLPVVCVVVRSAKQFRLQCTLESLQ